MIKTKNIVSKSIAAFVGNIDNNTDYLKQIEYARYNLSWLDEFNTILYSLNGSSEIVNKFIDDLKTMFRCKIELLFSDNIGPVFGAMDLDQKIFQYVKTRKDIEYIWKFSNDIIADSSIFNVYIDSSCDFFYINNIGYAAFNNLTKEQLFENIKTQHYFYPQTNYYICKNNISNWYPNYSEIIRLKNLYIDIKKEHPEYYPWDAIHGCDCESMLAKTIIDNKLKPYHLLSDDDTKKIIEAVYNYRIGDGSHKNIQYSNVGNLCHYHFVNQPILKI